MRLVLRAGVRKWSLRDFEIGAPIHIGRNFRRMPCLLCSVPCDDARPRTWAWRCTLCRVECPSCAASSTGDAPLAASKLAHRCRQSCSRHACICSGNARQAFFQYHCGLVAVAYCQNTRPERLLTFFARTIASRAGERIATRSGWSVFCPRTVASLRLLSRRATSQMAHHSAGIRCRPETAPAIPTPGRLHRTPRTSWRRGSFARVACRASPRHGCGRTGARLRRRTRSSMPRVRRTARCATSVG